MNEHIRKINKLKNEKLKNKLCDENGEPLTSNGMPFNLIPWGVDQQQFQQETIDKRSSKSRSKSKDRRATTPSPFRGTPREKSRDSTSKSDRGALGMEFLDFKPKQRSQHSKRKHSYQNTTKERHIEIEEKDSIEFNKNKVSYAKVKKTVIYNKTERSNEYEPHKIISTKTYEASKKHKKNRESVLRISVGENKRSRSSRSTSKKRDTSNHTHKEILKFIENQHK